MNADQSAPERDYTEVTPLTPAARAPFNALLVTGGCLAALAALGLFLGFTSTGYGQEEQQVAGWVIAAIGAIASAPLLAASGIVAGLGPRLPSDTLENK
ncbi:hypothetical protein [Leucobacter chironomi]|uniref:hypothetical protein n=1 Tax=Leucobacter chironomi TaxID=491918 RepID=UPI0003F70C35|nr:hypothetical protein [Leucobacter chironomi]